MLFSLMVQIISTRSQGCPCSCNRVTSGFCPVAASENAGVQAWAGHAGGGPGAASPGWQSRGHQRGSRAAQQAWKVVTGGWAGNEQKTPAAPAAAFAGRQRGTGRKAQVRSRPSLRWQTGESSNIGWKCTPCAGRDGKPHGAACANGADWAGAQAFFRNTDLRMKLPCSVRQSTS